MELGTPVIGVDRIRGDKDMSIIEHGMWERYTPDPSTLKVLYQTNILYVRRTTDNVDWYEYVNIIKPFKEGSVVMTVQAIEEGEVVQAASQDHTAVFPISMKVIEETEYTGTNAQEDFGQRMYSADLRQVTKQKREFKHIPTQFEQDLTEALHKALARIEALEKALSRKK
jgi:hypothetical protein